MNFESDQSIKPTLSRIIIERHRQCAKKRIIAISGAADLGKSTLAQNLAEQLNQQQLGCHALTLDAFLMDRPLRLAKGLTGYQAAAYDLNAARAALLAFHNGEAIQYRPYHHRTGLKDTTPQTLSPTAILLLEGLHASHPMIADLIDFHIFIYADDALLKRIRFQSDLTKRHYTADLSASISESELQSYKQYIAPYKMQSNVVIRLEKKWLYTIERMMIS